MGINLDDLTEKTEKSLLIKLRMAVLATLFVAVIAVVGSIIFLVFQYSQPLEVQKPENKPQITSIKADDFLKQMASNGDFSSEKANDAAVSQSTLAHAQTKYLDEAKKIVVCSKESNAKSGLDTSAFTPQLAETFQHELQGVADSLRGQRGILYVADAVRFFCEVMSKAEVIAYKKSNSEVQLFDAVINFHLKHWDQLNEDLIQFRQNEQQRVLNATAKEELRVLKSQFSLFGVLSIVGGSLGLLMATALYFVLARVESTVKSLYRMVEPLNLNRMPEKPLSQFSELPLQNPTHDAPLADSTEQTA